MENFINNFEQNKDKYTHRNTLLVNKTINVDEKYKIVKIRKK